MCLLFFLASASLSRAETQPLAERGLAGTLASIERLPVVASALHIVAHPDDENGGMLRHRGRGTHVRTARLTATRGEGGRRVRFFTVTGLVTQLLEKREELSLERFHRQLERSDLIILDELGYVPFSKAGAELFFGVVSRAYEQTSLLVTSHLPFEALDRGHGR